VTTASELMTGLAATTLVWTIFVPELAYVRKMPLAEFRCHEGLAVAAMIGVTVVIAGLSKDSTLLAVGMVVTGALVGVYEWKMRSTSMS
jgi:hypothetical protein